VGRGPVRRRAELRFDGGLALGEARGVEEALLVQARDDAFDLGGGDQTAVALHHHRLDVDQRVLAVEQRDDLEQRAREQHDGVGVAGRVAQRDDTPALVLDGKGVDVPQAREQAAGALRGPAHRPR